MATQPQIGKVPAGFKSPFTRIAMEGTHDDQLACVATLIGKSLSQVIQMAQTLGMPKRGPYWIDDAMVQKLLWNLSDLMASDWVEVTKLSDMPDVVILCVDYDAATDLGRCVVHHNVRGVPGVAPFGYIIDVGNWIEPVRQVTPDTSGLNLKQCWYREISRRPTTKGK